MSESFQLQTKKKKKKIKSGGAATFMDQCCAGTGTATGQRDEDFIWADNEALTSTRGPEQVHRGSTGGRLSAPPLLSLHFIFTDERRCIKKKVKTISSLHLGCQGRAIENREKHSLLIANL